jgi:KTSC domain
MNRLDIDRMPLDSALLASVGYSRQAILEIEFRNGSVYRYFLVPQAVFDGLLAAPSKGTYFNRHVRNRFREERVE